MPTSLKLFGVPYLQRDGASDEALPLQLNLPCLLLIYLALRDDWVSRAELAYLFRPDAPEAKAKKYLRQLVHRAKSLTWGKSLELKDDLLRFDFESDVKRFKDALKEKNWQLATKLHEDSLLGNYSHSDLETFNAWLELERSELRDNFKLALRTEASQLQNGGQLKEASEFLERYLKLDALDEEAVVDYLKLSQTLELREKGLAAYKRFAENLKTEFDLDPLDETKQLAEALRFSKKASSEVMSPRVTHNLPAQATRFVGRKQDLTKLSERLLQESCRVLSLVGLGGTGKTRLALELGRRVLSDFKDGVFFVPLATITSKDALLSTIAQVLGGRLSSSANAEAELFGALEKMDVLLILDNVEQLAATPDFLAAAVEKTQKPKIVLTSRISMNLKAEWLYDVQGLHYPKSLDDDVLSFDAVKLFLDSSSKANPDLVLEDKDHSTLAQITQKVEGLPLALELASRWHRLLSFEQILIELETGFEVLSTEQSDIPQRQRSIAYVFEQTWQNLSATEQAVLAGLSVSQGGFNLEAAKSITGAHLGILLSLLNQGLIRKQAHERFDMHELLKQYANSKLESQKILARAKEIHLHYYLELTKDGRARISSHEGEALMAALKLELENLLAALDFALGLDDATACQKLIANLWYFLYTKGFYIEVMHYLQAVYDRLGPDNADRAEVMQGLGGMNIILGNHEAGERYSLESIALAEHLGLEKILQSNYGQLAIMHRLKGDLDKAFDFNYKSYEMSLQTKHQIDINLNNLGTLCIVKGDYKEAQSYLSKALTITRELALTESLSARLFNLSQVEMMLGNYDDAERYALENLELDINSKNKIALYGSLCLIYLNRQELDQAQSYADKCLELIKQPHEAGHRIFIYQVVSKSALLNGKPELAKDYALTALEKGKQLEQVLRLPETHALLASIELVLDNQANAYRHIKQGLDYAQLNKHLLEVLEPALDLACLDDTKTAYQLVQLAKQLQKDLGITPSNAAKQQLDKINKAAKEDSGFKQPEAMTVEEGKVFFKAWVNKKLTSFT